MSATGTLLGVEFIPEMPGDDEGVASAVGASELAASNRSMNQLMLALVYSLRTASYSLFIALHACEQSAAGQAIDFQANASLAATTWAPNVDGVSSSTRWMCSSRFCCACCVLCIVLVVIAATASPCIIAI